MNIKKSFIWLAIFFSLQVNAQNYLISFEGRGESKSVLVSTVKVENLTTRTNLTLNGNDILSLTFTNNIDPISVSQSKLKIFPNPMVDNSILEFSPPVAGDATVTIFEINGKPIAWVNTYLEDLVQNFKLTGIKNGFYIITVVGHGYQFSGKLISNGGTNGIVSIEKVNAFQDAREKQVKEDSKGIQTIIDMNYSPGEKLRFTGYSEDYSIAVEDIPISNKIIVFDFTTFPVVTTGAFTSISSTSAISGGVITSDGNASISARGVCWSTSINPNIDLDPKTSNGTGSGSYTSNITGLRPATEYHVRAFATNSVGTAYGNDRTFTTSAIAPSITTLAASSVTRTTATSGGSITSNGGAAITASGICWSTSHNPSITGSHTSDGSVHGNFTSSMTGLLPGTLYYIRSYATNNVGTSYGNELSFSTDPVVIPTLSTTQVSSVNITTAISGGNISEDGDGMITERGICWSTTPSPSIIDNLTSNGTGTGSFTSNITGLQASTKYYVRAYATNIAGTAYGNEFIFTTNPPTIATITTRLVSSVSSGTAVSGGNITNNGGVPITARGVCWSTSVNPNIALDTKTSNGTGTGSFTSNITGLQPATVYHVRAYATNSVGTAYGNDRTFTTSAIAPSITTLAASSVTRTTATSGGSITSNGGAAITASGICWSTSHNPSITGSHTSDGSVHGNFTSSMTGLLPGTLYYIRSYATNSVGISYGNELSFITNPVVVSTLSTVQVTSVATTTAVSGGNITDDGDGTISSRGICWSTTPSPTISDNLTSNGTGTGSFTSNISGLQASTEYYVRAYATNIAGTAYGNEFIFTTNPPTVATITTSVVSSVTSGTALSGGNITDSGGRSITARGLCWSVTPVPTINDNLTSEGTGTGSFIGNITGLQPVTVYHVRAYATNSIGTSYGNERTFTTPPLGPNVITSEVSTIANTTAIAGGNVTANGGPVFTARGVCWSTSTNPTVSDSHTFDGTGDGVFTTNLTGLTPNTLYYVRAYATSNAGTTYGNEITFLHIIPEINSCKWLNDASCFLNLSFDDAQEAHLEISNLLSNYGLNGTFYIQSEELEFQPSLINTYRNILLSGHEVGSHTVSHARLPILNEQEILYQIDSSVSRIKRLLNTRCTSLAHPYHNTNEYINNLIFNRNLFARNYSEYYSDIRPLFMLFSETEINEVTNFIDAQIVNNSTCLIAGHGIDGSGYSPNTTEFFIALFNYIKSVQNTNKVWVTTLSNGALYESLFYGVNLTSKIDRSNRLIKIKINYPDKPIYNNFDKLLFSLKITKSTSWSIQNSGIEFIENDTHYIFTIDLKQTQELTLQY